LAAKTLLECSFLIPTRRDKNLSDGKAHEKRAWRWLEDQLDDFGGATQPLTLYSGWYRDRDTGERVSDRSRQYLVAVPRSRLHELRSMLREACGVFRQKCIYLSIAGHVEFVEGPTHEAD
jgi:hypothetical protein